MGGVRWDRGTAGLLEGETAGLQEGENAGLLDCRTAGLLLGVGKKVRPAGD